METLIYVAIVFALSCVSIFVAIKICDDPPPGGFGSLLFVLLILGALATAIMYTATSCASVFQEKYLGVDLEEGRTNTEFWIYTGLVFACFGSLMLVAAAIELFGSGSIRWGELGQLFVTCIICTVASVSIALAASSIQDCFKDQPEPPPIERIHFDKE